MPKFKKILTVTIITYVLITTLKAIIWHQFVTCNWYGTMVYATIWPTLIVDGLFETDIADDAINFIAPDIIPKQLFGCRENYNAL